MPNTLYTVLQLLQLLLFIPIQQNLYLIKPSRSIGNTPQAEKIRDKPASAEEETEKALWPKCLGSEILK